MSRTRKFPSKLFFFVVLMLAIGLRLDFLYASHFVIDSDEAIVGLMARHILQGAELPTFYYGQHYMGSFEPILVAGMMKILGVNEYALKSVPLLFSLVLIYLIYRLGRDLGGLAVGRVAALLSALAPGTLVVWSAKARGGFIELSCIGAFALLLLNSWLRNPRVSLSILIGLTLGFGWWVNNQIIYFMMPIGFMMLSRLIALRQLGQIFIHLFIGLLSFILGSLPFWIYNIRNEFVSFEMFGGSTATDFLSHVHGAFSLALPILFGAGRFWQTEDVFPGSSVLLLTTLIFMLLIVLVERRRQLINVLFFKAGADSQVEVLLVFCFATLSIFCLSSFGYLVSAPRYLLPLYVAYFPLLAYAIFLLHKNASRLIAGAILTFFLFLQTSSCYLGGRAIPGQPFVFKGQRVSKDHSQLIRWLAEKGVDVISTNYWIGYRIAFETQEQVRFVMIHEPFQVRIPEYQDFEKSLPEAQMVFVLVPEQANLYRVALDAMGKAFSEETLSGYQVIWNIHSQFDQAQCESSSDLAVSASHNAELARLAVDGNSETRWASAKPQSPDMEFRLGFSSPVQLKRVSYDMGRWPHDYPRGLELLLQHSNGTLEQVLSQDQYAAIRYFIDRKARWSMSFDLRDVAALVFKQNGEHSIFDWSIAELEVCAKTEAYPDPLLAPPIQTEEEAALHVSTDGKSQSLQSVP